MPSEVRHINPEKLPKLPNVISHGIVVERAGLVYTSGQLAWDDNGNLVEGDLAAQISRAYANIDMVLEAAGTSRANIINETIYLAGYEPEDAPQLVDALSAARPKGSIPPTSTAVGVRTLFAEGFLVEIQVVAAI